jgi:hypothetical protein
LQTFYARKVKFLAGLPKVLASKLKKSLNEKERRQRIKDAWFRHRKSQEIKHVQSEFDYALTYTYYSSVRIRL